MKYNIWKEITKFVKEHKLKKRWHKALVCLAAVVVFCTVYALILPAITMEATCGLEEHAHTEACYEMKVNANRELACASQTHSHSAECTDESGGNICGKSIVVHTHNEDCYNGEKLVCTLTEVVVHTHDETCYDESENLVCGKEEIVIHTHDETCYGEAGVLVCEKVEVSEHHHSDDCLKVVSETEEKVLKCEDKEHTHNDDCYPKIVNAVNTVEESNGTISGKVDNITWTLTPNNAEGTEYTLTISGDGAVPNNFLYNKNNNASSELFGYKNSITELVVEEGIDSIGSRAFGGCKIVEASIASSVTEIGNNAFGSVSLSQGITFEEGEDGSKLTTIGSGAFASSSLTSISLPSSVQKIGDSAFYYTDLTSISIPSSVQEIESCAFQYCHYLKTIVFEKSENEDGELVSNLKTIGDYAFDLDNEELTSITIPASVETIGDYAFYENWLLEEILFDEGSELTHIGEGAFSGSYPDSMTIEIPEKVKYIGDVALDYWGYDFHIILRSTCIDDYVGEVIYADYNPFVLTVGKEVDVMNETFISILANCGLDEIYFEGPNDITFPDLTAVTGLPGGLRTEAGTYYVDSQGALYRLNQDKTANLAYVPYYIKGNFTVPKTIKSAAGEEYKVTGVELNAFFEIEELTSVTFEAPEQIILLEELSFSYLPNLTSVNGKTEINEVLDIFTHSEGNISTYAFYKTALTDDRTGEQTGADIDVTNDYGIDLKIVTTPRNTSVGTLPQRDRDTYLYYTGEEATFDISMTNLSNVEVNDKVIRLYMQFDNGDGAITNHTLGDVKNITSSVLNKTYVTSFKQVGATNLYYWEFPVIYPGDTLSLKIKLKYPSPDSAGGNAKIWASIVDKGSADILSPIDTYHLLNWSTKPDDYILKNIAKENTTKLILSDDNQTTYIGNMQFDISLTKDTSTSLPSLGKDWLLRSEYRVVITPPENVKIREDVIEAINLLNSDPDNYKISEIYQNGSYWFSVNVPIGDEGETELVDIFTLKPTIYNTPSLAVEDGNLVLTFQDGNLYDMVELKDFSKTLILGECVFEIEDISAIEEGQTLDFDSIVTVKQTYSFSERTLSTTATSQFYCGAANLNMQVLSSSSGSTWVDGTTTPGLGDIVWYKVSLSNTGVLPCTNISTVSDSLQTKYFIPAEELQIMFEDDTKHRLGVTITKATLGVTVEEEIITTDNVPYTITSPQLIGNNTYYGGATGTDDCIGQVKNATLTLKWEESVLKLVVNKNNGEPEQSYTIGADGDYIDIKTAFDSIGFVIEPTTQYGMVWTFEDSYQLFAGQTEELIIRSYIKNTNMLLSSDSSSSYYSLSGTNYNIAYVYDKDGYRQASDSCSSSSYTTSEDWEFYTHYLYQGNTSTSLSTNEEVAIGSVLRYATTVYANSSYQFGALPMVEQMQGANVLMVPAENNQDNAALVSGSKYKEIDGYGYQYLLNTPGTYEKVYMGNNLWADKVVVESLGKSGGLKTRIYWYVRQKSGSTSIKAYFLVEPDLAGYDSSVLSYTMSGMSWLNDHETKRLYNTYNTVKASPIEFSKSIITDDGQSTANPLKRTTLSEKEIVTYRIALSTIVSAGSTLNGANIYDDLPASISNYWTKSAGDVEGTVSIEYSDDTRVHGGDSWSIKSVGTYQQRIVWNNDCTFDLTGEELYIDVTLEFPSGEAWKTYFNRYSSTELKNTVYVLSYSDYVTHLLYGQSQGALIKGVYSTGIAQDNPQNSTYDTYKALTDEASRLQYTNSATQPGIVCYYVSLVNTGKTRIYLEDMQDLLPEGFTFSKILQNSNSTNVYTSSSYEKTAVTVTGGNQYVSTPGVTYQSNFTVTPYVEKVDGKNKVTFSFTSAASANMDKVDEKAFLSAGQGIQFAYFVKTNGYYETKDVANNAIAMPYYDYNGSGIVLDTTTQTTVFSSSTKTPNDGTKELLSAEEASYQRWLTVKDKTSQWFFSDVDIDRTDGIKPGITKSVKQVYDMSGQDTNTTFGAETTSVIKWSVTVANQGYAPMTDYTVTDVLQAPYSFVSGYNIVYNIYDSSGSQLWSLNMGSLTKDADGKYSLGYRAIELGQPLKLQNGGNYEVTLSKDTEGNEVLSLRFVDPNFAVPVGGKAELEICSKGPDDTLTNDIYSNFAYLTPSQSFDKADIVYGKFAYYNEEKSVSANSHIMVSYGNFTGSDVNVSEVNNATNTASANEVINYIVLPSDETENNLFRYTLSVTNATSSSMNTLTFVNNLPEKGDYTAYGELRESEYKVDLADELDLAVEVTYRDSNNNVTRVEELDPSLYTVKYSDKTPAMFVNEPEDTEERKALEAEFWSKDTYWSDTPNANTRSVRVIINDTNNAGIIPAKATVSVSFNAKIADGQEVDPGATAWNSFGYRYTIGAATSESAPFNVGVKTPYVPTIVKELENSVGGEFTAKQDETYRFVVYTGEALSLNDNFTETELAQALANANRSFTYVDVTVAEGSNISDQMILKNCKEYSYVGGQWTETNTEWKWDDLSTYTIVELPVINDNFHFGSIEGISNPSYTFIYDDYYSTLLNVVNIHEDWSIKIQKINDAEMNPITLPGAIFGLYSPLEGDKMTEAEYAEMVNEIGKDVEKTITSDEQTYYLTTYGMTKVGGILQFDSLSLANDEYVVAELKAPSGYIMKEEAVTVDQSKAADNLAMIEVINEAGMEMPETGGIGTTPYIVVGLLMMVMATYCIYKQAKRRKEGKVS